MTILKIGNAQSQLLCPDAEIQKEVSDALSFMVPGAEFAMKGKPYVWDGRKKLMGKSGKFPTGLLRIAIKTLLKHKVKYSIEDEREIPTRPTRHKLFKIARGWKARDYQDLALEATQEYARGVLKIGTGGGKTFLSAMMIEDKQVPTLFVTPDTGLREQTYEEFVGMFERGEVSRDITSDAPIVVSNIQSLIRKDPKYFERFGQVIIDEFHHSASDSYVKLNKMLVNTYYRYGMTGTFIRSDGTEMVMHGVLSNVIYELTCSDLIKKGWLERPNITIVRYELPKEYRRLSYVRAYNKIIEDYDFNSIVAGIAKLKIKQGKQTIVLVRRKEHGVFLQDLIGEHATYINGDDSMEFRNAVKQSFNDRKIPCVVATNILGEGQDIPSIDAFINARLQKTEIQTAQGIGRALRKCEGKDGAEVFDFLPVGQKHLAAHGVERINSYKKEPEFIINVTRDVTLSTQSDFNFSEELKKL